MRKAEAGVLRLYEDGACILQIEETLEAQRALVCLRGALSPLTAQDVQDELTLAALARPVLVLDCSGVTAISGAGLQALLDVHKAIAELPGGQLFVLSPSDTLHNALKETGLDAVFCIRKGGAGA